MHCTHFADKKMILREGAFKVKPTPLGATAHCPKGARQGMVTVLLSGAEHGVAVQTQEPGSSWTVRTPVPGPQAVQVTSVLIGVTAPLEKVMKSMPLHRGTPFSYI